MKSVLIALLFFALSAGATDRLVINAGNERNDNLGDDFYTTQQKANANFQSLWDQLGTNTANLTGLSVNVKTKYAAKGDGTDDTAAVQAAFDGEPDGSAIFFPPGTYCVKSVTFSGGRRLKLFGDGRASILHSPFSTNALISTADSNPALLVLENLTLDGNCANLQAFKDSIVNVASIVATLDPNKALECNSVTFTNSLRAAVRLGGYGKFQNSKFLNVSTNSCDGNGTPGDTYAIFAQPAGSAPNLDFILDNCDLTGCTGTDTNLVYLAAHGIFITEQDVTSGTPAQFRSVTISNSRFTGLGGWFSESEGAAIEVYNGCKKPVITGNHIFVYAQSAIKVQRTDDAIIAHNICENGWNATPFGFYLGVSDAIIFAPDAREGFHPFTGGRLGEQHQNAKISYNIIKNFQQTGIYCTGRYVDIDHNTFDTRAPTQGTNSPPACIALLNGETVVDANVFRNIPDYLIAATGPYTNIWVTRNRVYSGTAVNANGIFVFQGVTGLRLSDNYANLSPDNTASWFYLDSVTNAVSMNNTWEPNTTLGVAVSLANPATVPNYVEWNNSWQPWQVRRSWNGLTTLEVANLDTGTNSSVAGASLRVRTIDSGGGIRAHSSLYTGTTDRSKVVVYNDSTANGINIDVFANTNTFNIYGGSKLWFTMNQGDVVLQGYSTAPIISDTTNLLGNLMFFRTGNINRAAAGYNAAANAWVATDRTGNTNSIAADSVGTAGATRFLLWDNDNSVLSRVYFSTNNSAGTGYKILRIPN